MARVAELVKKSRDETFVEQLESGARVNMTPAIFSLGGATLYNEWNHVQQKLMRGLGIVAIADQASIRHIPSVPALGTSFGPDAATFFYRNMEESDCVVVMGANVAENHRAADRWAIKA